MLTINATLFGQMVTFAIFVWFTMTYVWPPIMKALDDRQAKIADGLAAAERGRRDLAESKVEAEEILHNSRAKAKEIVAEAEAKASNIHHEAKSAASEEHKRILDKAKLDADQVYADTKEKLRQEVASIVVHGVEQILSNKVDRETHEKMLKELAEEL